MIVGVVGNREAVVWIEVFDSSHQSQRLAALVDTGYNGHLTLSEATIAAIGLSLVGKRRAWLADGSEVELGVFAATIQWHDRPRDILVSLADGGTLLGMALLEDSRLTIGVIHNGQVTIEPLTPPVA